MGTMNSFKLNERQKENLQNAFLSEVQECLEFKDFDNISKLLTNLMANNYNTELILGFCSEETQEEIMEGEYTNEFYTTNE